MSQLTSVPSRWVSSVLEEAVDIHDNLREPVNSKERSTRQGKYPYYGATGQVDWIDGYKCDGEYVLLGEDGAPFLDPSRPTAYLVRGKFWVNNHAHILKGKSGVLENRFLLHLLNSLNYRHYVNGTTRLKLTQGSMRKLPLVLPSIQEQHRIVAKLDELFSELDAGVAALKRAQENLKRYRASVLKAAVEGELSKEWRRENPPGETGAELLQRVLAERRKRWEEEQLAKFAARDRKPPRNWRDKYKEPLGPDEGELPELPQGWCWATVDQVSNISSGQTPKGAAANVTPTGEVPWYKVGDMNLPGNERAMQHSRAYLSMNKAKALGLRVFPAGTIVFPKRGGAIATNKKRELAVSSCLDLNIMAMSPVGDVGTWLWWWFQSVDLAVLADGSNVPQINNQDILPLLLPLPPASEQKIVLDLVQELMDVWQRSLEAVKSRRTTSARLRQSILKLAFAGHLVPQDPTDEPASVLLERIRADQEGNRRKRRPARPIHKRKKQVL